MSAASPITVPGVGATIQFGTVQLVAAPVGAQVPCAVGPNSVIQVSRAGVGGTADDLVTGVRQNSTDENTADGWFQINAANVLDTSVVEWLVVGY